MKEQIRLIRLIVIKQWFHSIFTLVNANRPDGINDDINDKVANQIQKLAWERYCSLGEEIRELTKDTELAKVCF